LLKGPNSSLFCHDAGWIFGQPISFPFYFDSPLLSKIEVSRFFFKKNNAGEAAKSNHLSLLCVKIHL